MFRFLIVCICVIGYLILSIPILIVEWIVGKFNKRAKGYQLPAYYSNSFQICSEGFTGAKITIIGHENVPYQSGCTVYRKPQKFF